MNRLLELVGTGLRVISIETLKELLNDIFPFEDGLEEIVSEDVLNEKWKVDGKRLYLKWLDKFTYN